MRIWDINNLSKPIAAKNPKCVYFYVILGKIVLYWRNVIGRRPNFISRKSKRRTIRLVDIWEPASGLIHKNSLNFIKTSFLEFNLSVIISILLFTFEESMPYPVGLYFLLYNNKLIQWRSKINSSFHMFLMESLPNYLPFSSKNLFFLTSKDFKPNISGITTMNAKVLSF